MEVARQNSPCLVDTLQNARERPLAGTFGLKTATARLKAVWPEGVQAGAAARRGMETATETQLEEIGLWGG